MTLTNAPAIEVSGVSKSFPLQGRKGAKFTAVENINFTIRRGDFISLIGASGCGKTTLLRMMSGLVDRDTGHILINGETVHGIPPRIGFVFQEPALLPWRSVRANLAFALEPLGLDPRERDNIIEDKLRLTNLLEFANYYPHQLSGGMQQRAGLARALACNPDVLFMDEPLSALDAFTRRRLQQEIAAMIQESETTTVLVTHDVDEAVFFSDRIIVMGTSPGRVRETVDVPFNRPRTLTEMLGNPDVVEIRDHVLQLVLELT